MMLLEEPVRPRAATARRRAVWGRRHEHAKPNLPVRFGLLELEHTQRNSCIPHERRCSELGACRTYSARATGPALATALPCRTTKSRIKAEPLCPPAGGPDLPWPAQARFFPDMAGFGSENRRNGSIASLSKSQLGSCFTGMRINLASTPTKY